MSKIALAAAVVALIAAVPLTRGRAEEAQPLALAPYLAPGAPLPPMGGTTTTTTKTEAKPVPVPIPAATPATQPPQTSVASFGTTATPIQSTATPIQGTTTPLRVVSLRSGPNGGSPVIGTLHPGLVVKVLASAPGGWMQVETPAGSGWAYGSYLAPAGSTAVVQHPALPQE